MLFFYPKVSQRVIIAGVSVGGAVWSCMRLFGAGWGWVGLGGAGHGWVGLGGGHTL